MRHAGVFRGVIGSTLTLLLASQGALAKALAPEPSPIEMFPEIDSDAKAWPFFIQGMILTAETQAFLSLITTENPNVHRLFELITKIRRSRHQIAKYQDALTIDAAKEIERMKISVATAPLQLRIVELQRKLNWSPKARLIPGARRSLAAELKRVDDALKAELTNFGGTSSDLTTYPIYEALDESRLIDRMATLGKGARAVLPPEQRQKLAGALQRETAFVESLTAQLESDTFALRASRKLRMQWLPRLAGGLLAMDIAARIAILALGRNPSLQAGRLYVGR